MDVYTCIDHDCHWPVGVASVVVARDEDEARQLLDASLKDHGLKPHSAKPYTLQRLDAAEAKAVVLVDGNY